MKARNTILAALSGAALALAMGTATAEGSASGGPGPSASTPSQDNTVNTQNGAPVQSNSGTRATDNGARYNKQKRTTPHSDPTSEVPRPGLKDKPDYAHGHAQ